MNKSEYETYCVEGRKDPVHVIDMSEVPGEDRTLVYGYTTQRNTFHVYKADGQLHVLIYDQDNRKVWYEADTSIQSERCVPDKRAYPERCDLGFARLMRERDCALPFTGFDSERTFLGQQFAGLLLDETR